MYHKEQGQYDKGPIYEICDKLQKDNYKGVVVIKSTIELALFTPTSLIYLKEIGSV